MVITPSEHERNCLLTLHQIRLNGKVYKVVDYVKCEEFETKMNQKILPTFNFDSNPRLPKSSNSTKKFTPGRGILRHKLYETVEINNDVDNQALDSAIEEKQIAEDDYVGRVEQLMPGYFSCKYTEHIKDLKDERSRRKFAKCLIDEYPEFFKDTPGDELAMCPYPDMSFQDEVMRLSSEYLKRLRQRRSKPLSQFAYRKKFTAEEEEQLVS